MRYEIIVSHVYTTYYCYYLYKVDQECISPFLKVFFHYFPADDHCYYFLSFL